MIQIQICDMPLCVLSLFIHLLSLCSPPTNVSICLPICWQCTHCHNACHLLHQTALGEHEEGTLEDFYDFHTALAVLNAASENELSEYAARIIAVENQLGNITGVDDASESW